MKNSVLASVVAIAAMAGGGAYAADINGRGGSTKDSVDVRDYSERSWSGLWVGAFGGYSLSNTGLTQDSFHDRGEEIVRTSRERVDGLGGEGAFGQLQIGFDGQVGNRLVVGVFGGASFSQSESEISATYGDYSAGLTVEEGNTYFGGLRAGILLNKDNLAYVAGGYAQTEATVKWGDNDGGDSGSKDFDFDAWFAEVGFESRINNNLYGRVAGRYYFYDDKRVAGGRDGDENCWDELNANPGKLELMVGLSYKLGGGLPNLGN